MRGLVGTGVRYASAGEISLAYQVIGHGALDIVYVPGLLNLIEPGGEEPAIARHLERIGVFARFAIFDKRGTGLSDRVSAAEMADPKARTEDLRVVIDAEGLSHAALFATAEGAVAAILFAALYPERVDARDTIQPFPSFSKIHASALRALGQEIAAVGSVVGVDSG